MISIVLIEDDKKDIASITNLLQSIYDDYPYTLYSFTDIDQGKNFILGHEIQLVLLDLEFTSLNKTSIYLLDQVDPSVPVIIISNLTHYQRQLRFRANVVGFIPKAKMTSLLVRSVVETLNLKNNIFKPIDFYFPTMTPTEVPEGITISDIRWIDLASFRKYDIHMISGQTRHLVSRSFKDVVLAIKEQGVSDLQPISRNQIINMNYIKKTYLEYNGRVTLQMVGCTEQFHVGKNYTQMFRDLYIE